MKVKNLYLFIKDTLEKHENARNSDKKLYWYICQVEGVVKNGKMDLEGWMRAKSYETVRRTRQKVVESNPHLKPTDPRVAKTRGTPHKGQLYQDDIYIKQVQEALEI